MPAFFSSLRSAFCCCRSPPTPEPSMDAIVAAQLRDKWRPLSDEERAEIHREREERAKHAAEIRAAQRRATEEEQEEMARHRAGLPSTSDDYDPVAPFNRPLLKRKAEAKETKVTLTSVADGEDVQL